MVSNPPDGAPRIAPYLLYEDVDAALEFLARAFGFATMLKVPGPDGRTAHAEARLADGVVMMGRPGGDFRNPGRSGHRSAMVHVYVDAVDAHCERARAAGARILAEPADQYYGDRRYMAEDPAGHRWAFAQHVRDVAIEAIQRGS